MATWNYSGTPILAPLLYFSSKADEFSQFSSAPVNNGYRGIYSLNLHLKAIGTLMQRFLGANKILRSWFTCMLGYILGTNGNFLEKKKLGAKLINNNLKNIKILVLFLIFNYDTVLIQLRSYFFRIYHPYFYGVKSF